MMQALFPKRSIMRTLFWVLAFIGLGAGQSWAQPCTNRSTAEHDISNWRMVRVFYDNDAFAGSNRYYTHGLRAEVIAPSLFYLYTSKLLLRWGRRSRTFYGLAVDQDLFTPDDLSRGYRVGDRPFAGTLQLSNFMISNLRDERLRFLTEVQIGLLGPAAGGRILAQGDSLWEAQIQTDLLLGYRAQLAKGILESPGFDLSAYAEAQLNTVRTYGQVGAVLRAGRVNPPFYDLDFAVRSLRGNRRIFDQQFYLYADAAVRAVAYDATLQGGLIRQGILDQQDPEPLGAGDVSTFITRASVGFNAIINFIGLGYEHSFRSPTFEGGEPHTFGQVKLWVAW